MLYFKSFNCLKPELTYLMYLRKRIPINESYDELERIYKNKIFALVVSSAKQLFNVNNGGIDPESEDVFDV